MDGDDTPTMVAWVMSWMIALLSQTFVTMATAAAVVMVNLGEDADA